MTTTQHIFKKEGMYMKLILVFSAVLILALTGCGRPIPSATPSPGTCLAYVSTWNNVTTNRNIVLNSDCTATDADCNGTFTYSAPSHGFAVGATGTIMINVLTGQPGAVIQANGAKCPALGGNTVSYSIPTANQLQTNYGTGVLTYAQQ